MTPKQQWREWKRQVALARKEIKELPKWLRETTRMCGVR